MQKNQLLLSCLLLLSGGLFGQRTITGNVQDADGQSLIGATVLIKGSGRGTATDIDGNYSLEASNTDSLQVSYTGYASQTRRVGTRSVIDFVVSSDVELLDKVVVIGYGSVKKSDVTGAVGSLEPTLEEASQFTDVQSPVAG